jgi:hypothetical protein
MVIPAAGSGIYTGFIVDTVNWTITDQTTVGGATIFSASLSDLGGGDHLLDTVSLFPAAGNNGTAIQGSPAATGISWGLNYTGDGSTILVRRADLETVSLGAGTVTNSGATTGTTLTGTTTHTPASGVTTCAIRYICRNTVTTAHNPMTATFGGQTVVFPSGSQASNISAASKAHVGIGYVTGLTPGTPGSLAITSNRVMGQMVARIDDVPGLTTGLVGAAAASSGITSSATISVGATMTAANSLVLAIAGAINGGADPFSLSAGWTEQAEGQSGTAATDAAAVFGTKTGGANGIVETMIATGALATTAWGGAILELKI